MYTAVHRVYLMERNENRWYEMPGMSTGSYGLDYSRVTIFCSHKRRPIGAIS